MAIPVEGADLSNSLVAVDRTDPTRILRTFNLDPRGAGRRRAAWQQSRIEHSFLDAHPILERAAALNSRF